MDKLELPEGAVPHAVAVENEGQVAILRGWITKSGTFVIADIDTVGVAHGQA